MKSNHKNNLHKDIIYKLKSIYPEAFQKGKLDLNELNNLFEGFTAPSNEKYYSFSWFGKQEAKKGAFQTTTLTLKPNKKKSLNYDNSANIYIEADNLNALKVIRDTYTGQINCIFIDPPYNTQGEFIYPDNFVDPFKAYQKMIGNIDAEGNKTDTEEDRLGRKHTNWLNMMYSRLLIAYDLLADDGIIFITIDDNELVNLRVIMDEVFGHFVGQITYQTNPRGRSQDKYFATSAEYVVAYSKKELVKGGVSITKNDDLLLRHYNKVGEDGIRYRELSLMNSHREFGKVTRPNLWYPYYVDKNKKIYVHNSKDEENPYYIKDGKKLFLKDNEDIVFSDLETIYPYWNDGYEGCWTWDSFKAEKEENGVFNYDLLTCKKVNERWKMFRIDKAIKNNKVSTTMVKTLLTDKEYKTDTGQSDFDSLFPEINKGEKLFQSPKAVELVKLLLNMGTSEDSIVLDFFAGSGTTAQAIMELNADPITEGYRQYIMIQLPEPIKEEQDAYKYGFRRITELSRERIKRASEMLKQKYPDTYENVDTGFRTFELAETNFPQWSEDVTIEDYIEKIELFSADIKDTKAALYEILLLLREYKLDEEIKELTTNLYAIGNESKTLVYLENELSEEAYNYIKSNHEGYKKVIIYDNSMTQSQKLNLNSILSDKFDTL